METKVAENNLIELFNEYLVAEKGLSTLTIQAYNTDIKLLSQHLHNCGISIECASHDAIASFLGNLQSSSVARKLSTYRQFYSFLVMEGIIESNPVLRIKSTKIRSISPMALTVNEVIQLIEESKKNNDYTSLKTTAMLELLYSAGLRISEMLSLKVSDIIYGSNVRDSMIIRGKGDDERVVLVNDSTKVAIQKYYALHKKRSKWLFHGRTNNSPMSRQGFFYVCKQLASKVGIKHFSPHVMRHSFATHMIRAGMDIRFAQELLGHKSINSTQVYTKLSYDQLMDLVQTRHPLSEEK